MPLQNFEKGQRIKILGKGIKVDEAIVEEVKGEIISTRCDKIPDEVIKFVHNKFKGCWYYNSEGPKGDATFNQFLPYNLRVA